MLSKESILEIQILARQGHGVRSIARELGISRNTVRRYLRGERPSEATPRQGPGRPRKLARFEDWLARRVAAAAPFRIPATVLHREVVAMGFDGAERTVRRFVQGLTPPVEPEPVKRFETAPGEQTQMDWGEYRFNGRKVYCFVGVLGYSRWLYIEYVDSMRVEVLVRCHEHMFREMGGVTREILYDNMRTVVTKRDAYGKRLHQFQDEFYALAKRHGFRPVLCRPRRPQTKGKVERAIQYVAESFFHPLVTRLAFEGRTTDLAGLNAEARLWCGQVANLRKHGTTGEAPMTRLAAEQAALQPFASPSDDPERLLWPRYCLQRSPRDYDAVLAEVMP